MLADVCRKKLLPFRLPSTESGARASACAVMHVADATCGLVIGVRARNLNVMISFSPIALNVMGIYRVFPPHNFLYFENFLKNFSGEP